MPETDTSSAAVNGRDNPLLAARLTDDPAEARPLEALGPAYRDALTSMYRCEPQVDATGALRQIDDSTRIAIDEGMTLFQLAVAGPARTILEVGLAYGFSTVFLLAALEQSGGGHHIAIDSYQYRDWDGIGRVTAERLVAMSPTLADDAFTLIEGRSFPVLGRLIQEGRSFDLTFIDGYHRFDDVLVDFTLAARMCPVGGVIALHDMWLDSVGAVASFLRHNRADFVEVETDCDNLFVVRRVDRDRRDWTHFAEFPMR